MKIEIVKRERISYTVYCVDIDGRTEDAFRTYEEALAKFNICIERARLSQEPIVLKSVTI